MIKKLSVLLLALLAWSTPAAAQVLDVGSITANSSGGGCTGTANSCASFSLANAAISSVTLQVSGTFTGTLTFEGTSDNSTWFTLSGTKLSDGSSATTTTGTGQFSFNNSGLLGVRARATAAMTGTAVVTAARGYAVARWLTPFLSATYVTGNVQLTSSGQVGWTASATDPTAALDTVLCRGAANVIGIGGCTSSFPAIRRNASTGTRADFVLADNSDFTDLGLRQLFIASGGNGALLISRTAPSALSACGTSPAVTTHNGTAAWVVTGGTGGTATGCTVTLPAATTGWNCSVNNITASAAHRAGVTTVQTASTTTSVTFEYQTVSTGAATAFTASDVFRGICFAY
jgi:hypothetical protein